MIFLKKYSVLHLRNFKFLGILSLINHSQINKPNQMTAIHPVKFTVKLNMFLNLPQFVLDLIMEFLPPKSIFFTLPLTCKLLKKYLSSCDFLKEKCQRNCLGFSPSFKLPQNFNFSAIWSKISCKKNKNPTSDLPFYGFFTDGGMDENNTTYWVNRVFMRGKWSICSKSGKNFHILGGLIKGKETVVEKHRVYSEMFRLICPTLLKKRWWQRFFDCFRRQQSYIEQIMNERLFQLTLWSDSAKIHDFMIKNEDRIKSNPILNGLDPMEILRYIQDFNNLCHIPIEKLNILNNNYLINEKELEFDDNKIAVVTGVDVSRNGYFTCPVNCLMVFVSEESIDYTKDTQFKIFDGCDKFGKFWEVLEDHGLTKKIKSTNIPDFYDFAEIKKSQNEQFQYVLFKNNSNEKEFGKLKPMLWIKINDPKLNVVSLDFPKNNCFVGKTVLLKLLDCEKKDPWVDEYNIDVNFVVLKGEIINLQKNNNFIIRHI